MQATELDRKSAFLSSAQTDPGEPQQNVSQDLFLQHQVTAGVFV